MLLANTLYFIGPSIAATHLPFHGSASSNVTLVHKLLTCAPNPAIGPLSAQCLSSGLIFWIPQPVDPGLLHLKNNSLLA